MPTIITRGAVSAKAYGFGVSGGYSVGKSLRFRRSATAYLNRTFGTATNNKKWTWSGWVKRGILDSGTNLYGLLSAYAGVSNTYGYIDFYQDGIRISDYTTGTQNITFQTTQVFRDPSAWYHILIAVDTTQSTSTNRLFMYVNGAQVTSFSSAVYPTLNSNTNINSAIATYLGNDPSNSPGYFDGYLAEVNFVDGQQLTPSSFGAYDTNGVWQPIKYSGSYGTNGFYLNFGNTTSTTTLGYDTSGNGNNWTTNNISLTAGSTYDSMTDSPTVTSASVANYATLNATVPSSYSGTLSNGNLNFSQPVGATNAVSTVVPTSGKWYFEAAWTGGNFCEIGIIPAATAGTSSGVSATNCVVMELQTGTIYKANVSQQAVSSYAATTDICGVAFDCSAGTVQFYKNGSTNGTAVSVTAGSYAAFVSNGSGAQTNTGFVNFGQRGFAYTPPTGFNALNTYNLPTPTIANGAQYMAATTYTGNNSTQSINNGNNNTIATTFKPDLVWVKDRSATAFHYLTDSVRGANLQLYSNSTAAETSTASAITGFASNGFTLGNNTDVNGVDNYIGWQWKANGAGVSNTNGSITSTVSANTTAGFSVVTFTGTFAAATVGHGLGVAPSMIIVKTRTQASVDWAVYHTSMGATNGMYLNATNAQFATSTWWNNTSPTSSVFSVAGAAQTNGNAQNMVAYCWAAVAGYSAFGSYTGNGSADGTFVYTGFRPRWIMVKQTTASSTTNWWIYDSSRDIYNVAGDELAANTSNAESSGNTDLDLLSNGFKFRSSTGGLNGSGGTYIYAAFAETPFNYSRGR